MGDTERIRAAIESLLPTDAREADLDAKSASLVGHIRISLMIQSELFDRILNSAPNPSLLLAELLEDAGNRYLDLSDLVSEASKDESRLNSKE